MFGELCRQRILNWASLRRFEVPFSRPEPAVLDDNRMAVYGVPEALPTAIGMHLEPTWNRVTR
jgi:hypothetical protein